MIWFSRKSIAFGVLNPHLGSDSGPLRYNLSGLGEITYPLSPSFLTCDRVAITVLGWTIWNCWYPYGCFWPTKIAISSDSPFNAYLIGLLVGIEKHTWDHPAQSLDCRASGDLGSSSNINSWGTREELRSVQCVKKCQNWGTGFGWVMWGKVETRVTPRFLAWGHGTIYWYRERRRSRCEERDNGWVLATWNLWCLWRRLITWDWSPREKCVPETEDRESAASRAYGTEVLGSDEITQD